MTDPKFQTFQDETARLLPLAAVTATTNSSQLDQGATWSTGRPDGVECAVFMNIPALKTSVGDESYTVKAQESADGTTWVDISQVKTITAVGPLTFGIFIKLRYQRVVLTLGGTSPSITCEAFLNFLV